jgi:hypothetical protein
MGGLTMKNMYSLVIAVLLLRARSKQRRFIMKRLAGLLVLIVFLVISLTAQAQGPPHIWSFSLGDSSWNMPHGLALDAIGNIIMVGQTGIGPQRTEMSLIKFGGDASLIWSNIYGDSGSFHPEGIAVDGENNIIMTGFFKGRLDFGGDIFFGSDETIFLAKFDASGNHIWSHVYGGSYWDRGYEVCVDGEDNIFFTGSFVDTLDFGSAILTSTWGDDVFLAKLDTDGSHLWSKSFGSSQSNESQYGKAMDIDATGNVILMGYFENTVDFGGGTLTSSSSYIDMFLAKFDTGGNHLWSKVLGDTSFAMVGDVTVDETSSITITGSYFDSIDFGGGMHIVVGWTDIFLAKFDSNGTYLWSHSFGDTLEDEGMGLDTDGAGNIVVAGKVFGTVDFGGGPLLTGPGYEDAFIAKYDQDGNHIWSQVYGDTNQQWAHTPVVDAEGNTIVTGYFEGLIDFGGGVLSPTGGSWSGYWDSDIFLVKFGVPPVGFCPASYLSLAPEGVVPTTTSATFEERGVYITAIKDFEICALGMNIQLALPQEVVARIYEAEGVTRGALVAEEAWTTFLPGEVVHLVPINYLLQGCRDYEITFEFAEAPVWSWFDERTFTEPYDIGGVIRVRDGDYAGNASNFILPNFAVMGWALGCEVTSDLTPPGAVWSTFGDVMVDRGIYVTPNQTISVCGLAWEAQFPEVPVPITAKIYEALSGTRGDLVALGFGNAVTLGMTLHEISINAVLREGMEYDLVVEAPAADWACVSENTITLPYTVDDAIIVENGEQGGDPLDTLLTHFNVRWSPGTGGAAFHLGHPDGPYPPPNQVMGGMVRQGIYVTSLIDQNIYSLGWNADVALGHTIYARVYEAGGTTRGSLICEGSVVCETVGMRWHDIPVAVACTLGGDYDFEIETASADEWRWWNDGTGLPYDVQGVIQVRDAENIGDPGDMHLVELRMHECDAELTAVTDPAQPPKFHISAPYPNPTAATSTIEYSLDQAGPVTIAVYDVAGRRVRTLLYNEHRSLGLGRLEFDTSTLAVGVYFVQIKTPYKSLSRKITIVR